MYDEIKRYLKSKIKRTLHSSKNYQFTMASVYMFNTLPNLSVVFLNGYPKQYRIDGNSGGFSPPCYVPFSNSQIGIAPKSAGSGQTCSEDDKICIGMTNEFHVTVTGNPAELYFYLDVPDNLNTSEDLLVYIFSNKMILCSKAGIVLATADNTKQR